MCIMPVIDMTKTGQNIVTLRKKSRVVCKRFAGCVWIWYTTGNL